jgi:fused signal recognition particle receptor
VLREELVSLVDGGWIAACRSSQGRQARVVLIVGVNGAGKTTTLGKIARILVAEDKSVVLGAADTFRAAATEQFATWGERVGVEVVARRGKVRPRECGLRRGQGGVDRGVDTVVVDTAGRLQNKAGLMDELGKVKRVIEKQAPVTEVLLVLDATTGQNGLIQARVFSEVVDVTGIVLTKLDGSAKGGIVVAVQKRIGRSREARRSRRRARRPGALRPGCLRRRAARLSAHRCMVSRRSLLDHRPTVG